ncbi:transmembrane protein [Klebsiella grimontii]|nr:transmembrane protein [Klebsiella grimontii]
MDLARDNDRLKMDTISASLTLSAQGNRYLLLILDAQSKAPALNSVTALAERREPESTRIELNAQAHRVSDEEAVWRWARPQPLTSLRISLAGEGVLPVELAWRSGENEPWQPLTKTVLYQLDGKRSDDIPLSGQPVEAVRIKTINARLSASLPAISGARDKYQLVFNTQGKGPYMLAWGNRAAQKADVALDMLIPPSLRKTQAVNDLPLAVAQEDVTLGGEARLTATTATEQQSSWKTLLVWGALIFGVVVLALMAWRIWREVKKSGGV